MPKLSSAVEAGVDEVRGGGFAFLVEAGYIGACEDVGCEQDLDFGWN